ncbi:MAG: zinc ribbon domain-containing protein [bacterium]|nr:zinc ribbon domain-containing protein [bacterium]
MKFDKFIKKCSIISFLLFPVMVFAGSDDSFIPLSFAILGEILITMFSSIVVLWPLSEIISKENSKKTFWILFMIRFLVLLFFDLFITTNIVLIDIFSLFVGIFFLLPLSLIVKSKSGVNSNKKTITIKKNSTLSTPSQVTTISIKCAKCGTIAKETDKFCSNCGAAMDRGNIIILKQTTSVSQNFISDDVLPSNSDTIYNLPED